MGQGGSRFLEISLAGDPARDEKPDKGAVVILRA